MIQLSVIIPAYNMEALLPACLGSLLGGVPDPRLEALVVNDGSSDGTLALAREWEARHPGAVRVVDKPNGNYGSTINAALPLCRGRWVKILDSDDTFAPDAVPLFLDALENADADMAVTHFSILRADGSRELAKYNLYGREPYDYGRVYDLDSVLADGWIRFFLMHSLAWRTEMLRAMGYRQTEGVSYTDLEWSSYPLVRARSIVFLDMDLYQYNLAREGQTMDPAVMARRRGQLATVTLNMLDFFSALPSGELSGVREEFLRSYLSNRCRVLAKCWLLDIPRSDFDPAEFERVDEKITLARGRWAVPDFRLYPENKIIRIDAYAWWKKHRSRLPAPVEALSRAADKVVVPLYRALFRRQRQPRMRSLSAIR